MPASPEALLSEAGAAYDARDWATAGALFQQLGGADPDWANARSVPMRLAHCRIETASPDALPGLRIPPGRPCGGELEARLVQRFRVRAVELCRGGDFARASCLVHALADYDPAIAETIRSCIRPDGPPAAPAGPSTPTFPDDPIFSDAWIAQAKQRFAGAKVLIVYRDLFPGDPQRVHAPLHNLTRSAQRFGLEAHWLNSYYTPPGIDVVLYASWLQEQILAVKPDVIVFDDLFESGVSASNPLLTEQVWMVLEGTRAALGTKVVKSLLDAWLNIQQRGPTRPLFGVGSCVDLVHHMHPALTEEQSALERARSYCYLVPLIMPTPTVARGTIARACFAGSVAWGNIPRLAWWTELGQRAARIDFLETDHVAAAPRGDQAYANVFHAYQLSLNLTRRPGGVKILTGRTIDVLLCGGTLLEEDSPNSAHFLARGTHYAPFNTLDELLGLVDDLLADDARRDSLAREGHAWAHRYFTGDCFWAGLLARLFT